MESTGSSPEQGDNEESTANSFEESSRGWLVDRRSCLKILGIASGTFLGSAALESTDESLPIGTVSAYAGTGEQLLFESQTSLVVEESESNDQSTSADHIDTNVRVSGKLETTGTDWFAVDLPAEESVQVECDPATDNGVVAVVLYDMNGEFVTLETGPGQSVLVLEETTVGSGTHYVQVIDINDGSGDYTVIVKDESYDGSPTPSPNPTATDTPTPTPDRNMFPLAIEAEGASGGSHFEPFEVRSDGTAVGGKYIVVPDGTDSRQESPPDRGLATYTVEIPEEGEYAIWGRVRAESNGNSFYFGVDDRDPTYWAADLSSDWMWSELGERGGPKETISLTAGTHTLTVYWREDGMELDRMVVAEDLSYVPSGTGPGTNDEKSRGTTPTPIETPTPTTDDGQQPFHGEPLTLPGRVEAEDYDEGGEGVAYSDTDDTNNGGAYRDGAVDIDNADDSSGGQYLVGWMEDGEYLEYTVSVPAGEYEMRARIAAKYDAGDLHARFGNTEIGTVAIPTTGSWQDWTTVTVGRVSVEEGADETLRLDVIDGQYNLNWFAFVETDDETGSPTPSPTPTPSPDNDTAVAVGGNQKVWHNVQLTFNGPPTSENSDPNPFLQYRLKVTFTGPSGQTYEVPGYYAADGNAAETGASSGRKWRAHLLPDESGVWMYDVSFRKGKQVAVNPDDDAGSPTDFDGANGDFIVEQSDARGRDFRGKGTITNPGGHYLRHRGSDELFVKGGPNIPENFLGYQGFTNTPDGNHDYAPHIDDWNTGDVDWNDGDGRGIVGAINYIAELGANTIYFLPNNVGGDGDDTFPHLKPYGDHTRYDNEKLGQWERLFTHAESKGVLLHFVLAETEVENENYYDDGDLGVERKLFYRELIARFGHHCGIQWNIGEENDYGTTKRELFASHLNAVDPYGHPVTTHTLSGEIDNFYDPLLGNEDFDITSWQLWSDNDSLRNLVAEYRRRSAATGHPWVISVDEPGGIENDSNDRNNGYPAGRREQMWPTYMGGGGGFEWYIQRDGGGHSLDQDLDDLSEMQSALEYAGHAIRFLEDLPLDEMVPIDDGIHNGDGYLFGAPDQVYVAYLPDGDTVDLDLGTGVYSLQWYNPRKGNYVIDDGVSGGSSANLPSPPFGGDAVALLKRE